MQRTSLASFRRGFLIIAMSAGAVAVPALLLAKPAGVPKPKAGPADIALAREEFGAAALLDWRKVVGFSLVILGAAALGAVLAYHPSARHRPGAEDLEGPKIVITYTLVGALIAIVVAPVPAMAFAIFGIGGLTRFRTVLGAAKETGRLILATVVGLLCGLELWMAAVVGTVLAWIIIYLMEARTSMRMVVRGVRSETLAKSAEEYGKALHGMRCRFSPPRKNPGKGQLSFTVQIPRGLSQETLEARLGEGVPAELRGTIDWSED